MGSIMTNNGEDLMWDDGREGEKEIPASTTISLWCHSMLLNIMYVVSRENHLWVVWVISESV